MAITVTDKNLGHATAYGYAKSKGYTGTEQEFAELMASYATVAEQAQQSAEEAAQSADNAEASATLATEQAQASANSASASAGSATQASQSASGAAQSATQASTSASTASTKASEAATSAQTASTKASEAAASVTAAQTAQTSAETARTGAETARTGAETARTGAETAQEAAEEAAESVASTVQQVATNTQDISDLKDDLSNSLNAYTDDAIWSQGSIKYADGTNLSSDTRIRTTKITPVYAVRPANGYKLAVYGYALDGTYIGVWDGTEFTKNATTWSTTGFNISSFINAEIRIILAKSDNSNITPTDANKCVFYSYTDATLSKFGKSADAKATGTKVRMLDRAVFGVNQFETKTINTKTTNAITNNNDGTYTIGTADFGTAIFGSAVTLDAGMYTLFGVEQGYAFISIDTTYSNAFAFNFGKKPATILISEETTCYLGFRNEYKPSQSFVITPFLADGGIVYDAELLSPVADVMEQDNLIGNEVGVLYPIELEKGAQIIMSTKDGSNVSSYIRFDFYNADQTERLDYYVFTAGTSERVITFNKSTPAKYVRFLTDDNGLAQKIKLAYGNKKTPYSERNGLLDVDIIPDYYIAEVADTIAKVEAKMTEPCLVFPLITDIHMASTTSGKPQLCVTDSIRNIKKVCEYINCDFVLNLGDSTDGGEAKHITKGNNKILTNLFKRIGVPYYFALGNHDTNYYATNQPLTVDELFSTYFCDIGKEHAVFNPNSNGGEYYVDFSYVGIRLIVLNANYGDGGRYAFSDDSASWLSSALDTNNIVIVCYHLSPINTQNWNATNLTNGADIASVLQAFVTGGGVLISLCGHSHCDYAFETPWTTIFSCCNKCEQVDTTTPGYTAITGYTGELVAPERTVGTVTEDCWSICVVRPQARKISLIRFGAGVDREFSF